MSGQDTPCGLSGVLDVTSWPFQLQIEDLFVSWPDILSGC